MKKLIVIGLAIIIMLTFLTGASAIAFIGRSTSPMEFVYTIGDISNV